MRSRNTRPVLAGLVLAAVVAALVEGCSSSASNASAGATDANANDAGVDTAAAPDVELLAVADLPRITETQGLSGTWFDLQTRTLYAIQDTQSSVTPLSASADWTTFTPGAPITLAGRPDTTAWDGEGLARAGDGFIAVTVETVPLVERFDLAGQYLGKVDFPAHFAKQAPGNKGLESLSASPSGAFLFTANEAALTTDGTTATKSSGTLIRILRRDLATNHDEERAYRTEPLGAGTGGDMGVSDVTAFSDTEALVLERGYQSGYGNTVRIFRVDFAGSSDSDVSALDALPASIPVLDKKLVVDLVTLPSAGITHPGTQPNPILDNYEGLALGPVLPDGRRVVFVTSDDNASATQVARVLTLALRL